MKMIDEGICQWWSEPSHDISSDLAPCGCVSASMGNGGVEVTNSLASQLLFSHKSGKGSLGATERKRILRTFFDHFDFVTDMGDLLDCDYIATDGVYDVQSSCRRHQSLLSRERLQTLKCILYFTSSSQALRCTKHSCPVVSEQASLE
jgi:hypothetical protein